MNLMQDDRKISICIPTWQRSEMTIDAFYDVYNDERVSEVVIVDDASDLAIYEELKSVTDCLPKVKLYRNIINRDCYRNKNTAIGYSSQQSSGCILLDSDNKIDQNYIDTLYALEKWEVDTIYTPSFASPHFDFRAYEGLTVTKENVAEYIEKPMFEVCLNAANYFVNGLMYLMFWDDKVDPVTSDSIYMAYKWLEAGNKIYIVPGLQYEHRVHEGSHYKNNVHRTAPGFHESILQKLRELK